MSDKTTRVKKIWLLKGLPASGKSTWAREQVAQFPDLYKRVNKDDLRTMVDNSKWSQPREMFILRLRNEIIRESLTAGYDIIVDDTNLHEKHRHTMDIIAGEFPGTTVVEKFFDTPLEVCIERDKKRPNPVGRGIILDMWVKNLKPKLVPYLPSLPEAIVCDIDGTIADKGDRGWYDEDKVEVDTPIAKIVDLLRVYKHARLIEIVLVSGRHDSCRAETERWLKKNVIPYDYLFMRPAGNDEKDFLIKENIYHKNIEGKFNVLFVLDDRNQVVDLWRRLGLKCLQVDNGNF